MVWYRFPVEAYHKAYQAGILPERVELLDGEVYAVSPMGKNHIRYLIHLTRVLGEAFSQEALVVSQIPLLLSQFSEPKPDLYPFSLFRSLSPNEMTPSRGPFRGPHPGLRQDGVVLVLLRLPESRYDHRPPAAEDALLVVEIPDSTLMQDRSIKLPLYQEAGNGTPRAPLYPQRSFLTNRSPGGSSPGQTRFPWTSA